MVVVFWHWIFFVFVTFWDATLSLRITDLYVPSGASHEAPMNCKYDLEGEPLYDVKWYKDEVQFFGCRPDGTVQEFPLDGVSTYHSNYAPIGSCPINLTNLNRSSGGKYKCEVSLDAPTFRTVSETRTFNFIQYSKRTQELKEISTEKIRSSFQNRTSSSSSGQISTILHVNLLVIFMLLFF